MMNTFELTQDTSEFRLRCPKPPYIVVKPFRNQPCFLVPLHHNLTFRDIQPFCAAPIPLHWLSDNTPTTTSSANVTPTSSKPVFLTFSTIN